ncbi:glutathione S-transferase family protein [Algicella marina]|uniref:Glutathione S-transferase n=1 Tax=Algicella marina TaxID=2683284 RepID=A0A6P1T5N6_9RHOB|nr:glutathione S-transferase family protein [Algicella marina]QHQ36609.1 glutathione S-transferase [Algicella marina]
MYTVIGTPKSRALRVIWALEELEQEYEVRPANPQSEEAFLHNPLGKIPSLLIDDTVLTDSVAILTWLADRHGSLTHPAGSLARAQQDAATQFAVCEIDAALWTKAKHAFVLPQDLRVEAVKKTAAAEFARAMEQLEARLGDKPFISGEILTVPDIIISHCAGWALSAKMELPKGPVGDYLRRLRKRPAMQRSLAKAAALS